MKKAKYICLEGTEGVGKTTQTDKLVSYLKDRGYKVLQTKEPGTPLSDITMKLRGIMLDNQYDNDLTNTAREFISQAIRSIHIEKVIMPALNEYDFIVQDRGVLSGLAYGTACGNDFEMIEEFAKIVCDPISAQDDYDSNMYAIYDSVIYLKGDVNKGLETAKSAKQEFESGDAMESRGNNFMNDVANNMDEMSSYFNTSVIDVQGKSIEDVFAEICLALEV